MPFHSPLPIGAFAAEFYTLEALTLISAENAESFKKSHERFKWDLLEYKRDFEERFAIAMRDYLVLASLGEARHAYSQCEHMIEDFPHGGDRCGPAYRFTEKYTWQSLATAMCDLFSYSWHSGYGGEKWASIAQAALLSEKLPTTAFIDHCIDLSHNGGYAFNKDDYSIFSMSDNYEDFLTAKSGARKAEALLDAVIDNHMWKGVSKRLVSLLYRANNLGFISEWLLEGYSVNLNDFVSLLFRQYTPVIWGNREFLYDIRPKCRDCYDCDDTDCDSHPNNNCSNECNYECNNKDCDSHPCQNYHCGDCPETDCGDNILYCNDMCYESCQNTECSNHPTYCDEEAEEVVETQKEDGYEQCNFELYGKLISEEVVLNVRNITQSVKEGEEKEEDSDAA